MFIGLFAVTTYTYINFFFIDISFLIISLELLFGIFKDRFLRISNISFTLYALKLLIFKKKIKT